MIKKKKGNFTLKNITEDKVWESENIFHLKSDVSRYGSFYLTMKYINKYYPFQEILLNVEFLKEFRYYSLHHLDIF